MNIIDRLRNIIGYYHWLFLARKEFKDIQKCKVNLRPGYYYVSCNVRTFLYRGKTPNSFLEMIGVDTSKPKLFAFCVKKQIEGNIPYTYDVVMSTNEGYRFYNLENNTTLHLFENKYEASLYKKCYSLFSPFFSLTACDMTEAYTIETIINNKHRKDWTEEELLANLYTLLDSYTAFLRSAKREIVNYSQTIIISDRAGENYRKLCELLLEETKPFLKTIYVFSHGDLHFGNILYDGNKQYLIDFEKARKEVFFFDLFNVLYVEAVDYNNYFFLDDYLIGNIKIINCFQKAFDAVGVEFDIKQRVKYLKLFLLTRVNYDIEYYLRNNILSKCESKIDTIRKLNYYIDNYKKHEI